MESNGTCTLGSELWKREGSLALETPSLAFLLVCVVPECLNSGFSAQNWGEDLVWLHADSLKGLECTGSYHRLAWDGVRAHQRSPIIIMQRVEDASAMGALLSTASQWGAAPVAAEMESLDLPGVGLTAQPTVSDSTTGKGVEPAAMGFVGAHNGWQVASWWQLLRRKRQWLFLQKYWFSSSYLTLQLRAGSRASTPTTREQTLHQHGCERPESKVKTPPTSSVGSHHHNTKHTPIKGIMARTFWWKAWQASTTKGTGTKNTGHFTSEWFSKDFFVSYTLSFFC